MPVALPLQKWPFSRDVNMREELIINFLRSRGVVTGRGNPAAMPSTLMDFGFWDMPQAKPTPVGQALLDGKIFWSECVLWLLSKRPSSREKNNIKPLVVVCKFLSKCREMGLSPELWKVDISLLSEVESYDDITEAFIHNVIANRSVSSSLHGYADIWINAFEQTALFKFQGKSSDKHLEVVDVNSDSWQIVKYLALVGPEMSQTPPKSNSASDKKVFYEYMGSTDTGIVEIIAPPFMRNLIPNLSSHYAHLGFAEGKTLKEKFSLWLIATGRSRAATSYPPSLEAMSAPQVQPPQPKHTTYSWPGMIEFLTGIPPSKPVFEIDNAKDFLEIYQPLKLLAESLSRNVNPGFENQMAFEECWDYTRSSVKWGDKTTLMSAFKAYSEFLKWLESINPSQEKKLTKLSPANVDRLSVALKLFADARKNDSEEGWFKSGCEVNGRIREYFDPLTVAALQAFDDAKIEELFCGKKGADGKVELETMWSGKNGQGWAHIKPTGATDLKEIVDFLVELKTDVGIVEKFLKVGFKRPKGFGPSVISELLMKFHPESCIKHGEVGHKVLTWLGLIDSAWNREYSDGDYKQVRGAAAKIIAKMKAMNIPRQIKADGTEDTSPPDYLTVNEFLWWLNDTANKNLIKEKIMAKEFKNVEKKPKGGSKKLSDTLKDSLLQRLAAALRTKPFAILAGHSGTGKSQMVRKLAYMTCADEGLMNEATTSNAPGNYCMIQVRPNWHDSTDLLGYYSELREKYRTTPFVQFVCKAYAYPDIPFFVCLDEMNLAPVEQYFAEYLSAIESMTEKDGQFLTDPLIPGKYAADDIMEDDAIRFTESKAWYEAHGLTLPKNLFVVGTVNMDDTTCQFSRKVLDRAMTIMMDKVDFKDMQDAAKSAPPSKEDLLDANDIKKFLKGKLRADPLSNGQVELLKSIDEVLGKTPFAVAYRYANEYALYEDSLSALTGKPKDGALDTEAMDHCVLMKVLPRIHGENRAVERIFKGNDSQGEKGLMSILTSPGTLSGAKMQEILDRKQTYLSFWP